MSGKQKILSCKNAKTQKGIHFLIVRFVLMSCLISHMSFLSAQISATFKGDSSRTEIGDHFTMKLVINAQKDIVVDFPKFPGDTIGKIDIVKKDKIDTASLGGNVIYSQNVTISAYEEGRYFFSPMKIYFLDKRSGVVDSVYTSDFMLSVTGPQVDTTKPIKPIKAPLKVDYKVEEFTWWIVGGLVLLAAIIIGIILYIRSKRRPAAVIVRPRPKEPAHIWANQELKKLEAEKLWQKDEMKQYHSRLSDILRLYLEYRYNYYAMEATTEEILQKVYQYEVTMDAGSKLRETLALADFVKFAKMNPAPDQNMKSMESAMSFVNMTKQTVEESNNEIKKPNK